MSYILNMNGSSDKINWCSYRSCLLKWGHAVTQNVDYWVFSGQFSPSVIHVFLEICCGHHWCSKLPAAHCKAEANEMLCLPDKKPQKHSATVLPSFSFFPLHLCCSFSPTLPHLACLLCFLLVLCSSHHSLSLFVFLPFVSLSSLPPLNFALLCSVEPSWRSVKCIICDLMSRWASRLLSHSAHKGTEWPRLTQGTQMSNELHTRVHTKQTRSHRASLQHTPRGFEVAYWWC